MKIIDTKIHDIDYENIDKSKVNLSDKIIKSISPLLDNLRLSKLEECDFSKAELLRKSKKIKLEKNELNYMLNIYKKQKKINKLLERISKIIYAGLANSGSYRHEIVILLKVIDTLSDDKLNYHLSETIKVINKRFSVLI